MKHDHLRTFAENIVGLMVLGGIWLALFLLAGIVEAGSTTFLIKPGERFSVECVATTEPTPPPTQPPPTQPPPTQPPSTCKGAGYFPYDQRVLRYGKDPDGIVVQPGKSIAYRFNTNTVRNGLGSFVLGPHFAKGAREPSNMNTITVSKCPGDFNVRSMPRGCYGAGIDATLNISVGRTSPGACTLDRNTVYYINVAPMHPVTHKSTCRSDCGMIFSYK